MPTFELEKLLQTLMDGFAVGSLYALIALGYTMVYGILKFINFAHSDVFVLGAWVSFSAAIAAGWAPPTGWIPGDAVAGLPVWYSALPDWMPHIARYTLGIVPRWVSALLGLLTLMSLVSLAYERFVQPGLSPGLARRLARINLASTLALMAGWGWAVIALIHLARVLKSSDLPVVAGGVLLVVAMLTCGLVGFTVERLAYKPLRKAPRLNVLITAIGVSLLLQNLGQLDWMFGTRPQSMPILLPDAVLAEVAGTPDQFAPDGSVAFWKVQPVRVRLVDVVGAGTAVLLMIVLDWLVFRTRLGRAMRAVSYNTNTAALMGINVNRVISFTFVLGAMLAAAAGFLYSQKYNGIGQTATALWVLLGLKAFVAAVVGGIGNIRGAMLGGLLIGLLEFFGKAYISTTLADVCVFGLLILVLLFRPSGLLGSTVREKV